MHVTFIALLKAKGNTLTVDNDGCGVLMLDIPRDELKNAFDIVEARSQVLKVTIETVEEEEELDKWALK